MFAHSTSIVITCKSFYYINFLFVNVYHYKGGEKPKMRLLKNLRGQGVIYVLITMMVTILVGIFIVNALIGSVTPDDTWSTEANTTWTNTQTNIWLAFSLVVIGIIIMGAMAILAIMRGGGGGALA